MTDLWDELPELKSDLEAVRARMASVVRGARFPLAGEVMSLVDANGKMLRPALLFLGGRFGRKDRDLVDLAAAVELLHVATLVHDDVIDDAGTRRGVPTVHATRGVKEAVLAGDWLFSRCFSLAAGSSSPDNARVLAAFVAAICSSEISQDMGRYQWSGSERAYLRTIAGKTAALFAMSLRAGAVETQAPVSAVSALTRAGYAAGMAFQIMDDVLDYESTDGLMRKPVAKDAREGLCTLPLLLALRSDGPALRPLLGASAPDDCTVSAIVDIVRASGAVEASKSRAGAYTDRAMAEIGRLPRGRPRDELGLVVARLLERRA